MRQSLGYHYTRTLIHRPAVGSSLGKKASSSVVILAQSSKHIIQIIQLLEERRMSFSFCLNKNELLLLAGFGLLFQGLDLDRKGKLIQDSQRLLCSVVEILERNNAPGAADFKKVVCAMISVDRFSKDTRASSNGSMPAPKNISKSTRKLQAIASRFSNGNLPVVVKREPSSGRRSTAPTLPTGTLSIYDRSNSQNSVSSAVSDPISGNGYSNRRTTPQSPHLNMSLKPPNLDYLSFNEEPSVSPNQSSPNLSRQYRESSISSPPFSAPAHQTQAPADNLFTTDMFSSYLTTPPAGTIDWCPDVWNLPSELGSQAQPAKSFSEEELTSGEEFSSCEMGLSGVDMRGVDSVVGLEGLDGAFTM